MRRSVSPEARGVQPLELELHLLWVLGIELEFSGKPVSALDCLSFFALLRLPHGIYSDVSLRSQSTLSHVHLATPLRQELHFCAGCSATQHGALKITNVLPEESPG